MEAELQGVKVKGDGEHCSLGSEHLSGWTPGREWVKVQGVEGVERQPREPCGGLQFAELRVGR